MSIAVSGDFLLSGGAGLFSMGSAGAVSETSTGFCSSESGGEVFGSSGSGTVSCADGVPISLSFSLSFVSLLSLLPYSPLCARSGSSSVCDASVPVPGY